MSGQQKQNNLRDKKTIEPGKNRFRNLRINAGLFIISTLFCLFLLEMGLRLVAPHVLYSSLVPNTDKERNQNIATFFPGLDSVSHFSVNEFGYRSPTYFDQDRFGILAIGGSTTQCINLSDNESWPWILEEKLNTSVNVREFTVGNIGAAAFNSGNHYHQLKYIAPQFENIRMALMLVGINDYMRLLRLGKAYYPTSADEHLYNRSFVRLPRSGKPHWYQRNELYMHIRDTYNGLRSNTEAFDKEKLHSLLAEYESALKSDELPDMGIALVDYENNLRKMAQLARERNIILVLISQPSLWHKDMGAFEEKIASIGAPVFNNKAYSPSALSQGMDIFNEKLRLIATEEDIPFIDLASKLPKDTTVFYDWCHYNKRGSHMVAELIYQDLKPTLESVQSLAQLMSKQGMR